jgi:hypothetical protein
MSSVMESRGQIPKRPEGDQNIGNRLETMSRIMGDFFMNKLHQESLASGRPRMAAGYHEIIDDRKRKITYVRTSPSLRHFENRVTITEPDQDEFPDLAEPEEYRWQAAVPKDDVSKFIGRDMSELEEAVELLQQEHDRLLVEERKADGQA